MISAGREKQRELDQEAASGNVQVVFGHLISHLHAQTGRDGEMACSARSGTHSVGDRWRDILVQADASDERSVGLERSAQL
jgi:hypothetical protein